MSGYLLKYKAVQCLECKDILLSRAEYDFHHCSCRAIAVDGGPNNTHILGDTSQAHSLEILLPVTPQELFEDWDKYKDKYKRIPLVE